MLNKLKYWIKSNTFKYSSYKTKSDTSIKLFWWNKRDNFGDLINFNLISSLSKDEIEWVPPNYDKEYYMSIGSIIHLATDKTIIWGSGLISDFARPLKSPKEILAVRGPLTREMLLKLKIKCPDIYGDPALLLPNYYMPEVDQKYDLGIIPHFMHKKDTFFNQDFNDNIKVIDIEQDNPMQFIHEVLECKKIVSSALHGIIVADAYDIPSLRVTFSNKLSGGDFKFNDYYLSVNKEIIKPYLITDKISIDDILSLKYQYAKKIKLDSLINVCPFKLNLNRITGEI